MYDWNYNTGLPWSFANQYSELEMLIITNNILWRSTKVPLKIINKYPGSPLVLAVHWYPKWAFSSSFSPPAPLAVGSNGLQQVGKTLVHLGS